MEIFALFLLTNVLVYGDLARDPAHAAWFGRRDAQQLECERLSQAEAHARHPGAIPAPHARAGALMQIDALECRHLLVERGARSARDEAILQRLDDDVAELTGLAASLVEEDARFVVDAFYPSPAIVRKVATSARVSLAERGRLVSDAPPRLTAGDVEVFRTVPMRDAIPLACRRLFASGSLAGERGDDVVFLAIALLHPKESQLHAGLCRRGEFRWLR